MTTVTPAEINRFWIEEVGPKGWYERSDALDQQIRDRFRAAWDDVAVLAPAWAGDPEGALAALILFVGFLVAGFARRSVKHLIEKNPKIDPTLAQFFGGIVRYAILAVVIIAVLTRFGVETTSLVAALGAATLAIGLALQGTLSNVAAGVMIVFFRPYKIGQYVSIGGTSGTVKDLNIFVTELVTPDNVQIIMPNG